MKAMRILFLLFLFGAIAGSASAQKYAYVNTQKILEKMPEFKAAQQQLDELSDKWQKEIDNKQQEIAKMWDAYQKEKILLPEEERTKREAEINKKDLEVRELQKQRFGVNGELHQKRQELIRPIQEKIQRAIKEVAETGGYAFIFDTSQSAFILYADPKLDKTDAVLKKLGIN
jgi:outer membrane protein